MAGNMRDMSLAFEAAEAGLREGELWLDQQRNEFAVNLQDFAYTGGSLPDITNQNHDWWTGENARTAIYGIAGSPRLTEVATQPRFVIEDRGFIRDNVEANQPLTGTNFYRITARGTGGTDSAQSITQNTYAKRFN